MIQIMADAVKIGEAKLMDREGKAHGLLLFYLSPQVSLRRQWLTTVRRKALYDNCKFNSCLSPFPIVINKQQILQRTKVYSNDGSEGLKAKVKGVGGAD